ncbi:ABC transporter ATP-binding protein [Actinomadura rugatobispora]|uniref:ABC transporter ATP-binding protein n=1 Tax=Actinomadura rugatobispora TaxID=1994 RepID=A0ABW1ACW9_9ACTN
MTTSVTGEVAPKARTEARESVLAARNVSLTYGGLGGGRTVEALREVNIEVPKGQFVALVGASGCGKTSLLNMFAGLVEPTEGEVVIDEQPVRGPSNKTSYMFARDGLLPWRRVHKNVELGLEARTSLSRAERLASSRKMLELVGLADFEKVYPRQLSHGMRQRAAIARTLVTDPDILLMDEPFGALDAQTKLRLQAEFLDLLEQEGSDRVSKTVLFVTHDLNEAILLADRVVVMLPRPGRIASDQPVDLPRPRSGNLKEIIFSPEFQRLHRDLFDLLQEGEGHE